MPNHAAYTAGDVEDARRGHPAVDLTSYARARGLEPLEQALVGHFSGLNPVWPEYVFNVMRGELVPGRFGTVQHELDEVDLGDDGSPTQAGTYFGRRSSARPGLRSLIGLRKKIPNEPFATQAMWLPTTAINVLVPEAAVIPRVVIKSKDHMSFSDTTLGPAAPSFRMASSRWVAPELRAAFVAAVGPTLEALGVTYTRLKLAHGALGLSVDGFRAHPADIDRLVAAAGAMADAVADLARPWWAPAPFDQSLGPIDTEGHPPGYRCFVPGFGLEPLERDAGAMGLAIEDPVALHRRFPCLRLPGTSLGVVAGALPGTTVFGRFTWQTQSHPSS